ncbi:unnamed protein product [Schistocephalus solidus]|uniref:Reverse transcriptase domain-containing protein n=1 Tax=Schistocephalus solidus TaxID=70667 RepID=A0A183TFZ0_SCHSO|nr:unnamed protein product [Schistocephalus solidus]
MARLNIEGGAFGRGYDHTEKVEAICQTIQPLLQAERRFSEYDEVIRIRGQIHRRPSQVKAQLPVGFDMSGVMVDPITYVDDLVLVAESPHRLQRGLDGLANGLFLAAPLKPQQRISLLKRHCLPKRLHELTLDAVHRNTLKRLNTQVRSNLGVG